MNNEIIINGISSSDLEHALTHNWDIAEIPINLLLDLFAEYDEVGSLKLFKDWNRGLITLQELIPALFEALQPHVPLAPESIEIDFDAVVTVTKRLGTYNSRQITVKYLNGEELTVKQISSPAEYTTLRTLIDAEIAKRGVIGIDTKKYSYRYDCTTWYFSVDTNKKLTDAQTRALGTLLKAYSQYEIELADTPEDAQRKPYLKSYYSNDELNKSSSKSLIKRGLLIDGNKLSSAGLALATKLHPEFTVAGLQIAQQKQNTEARQKNVIKRGILKHYIKELGEQHCKIIIPNSSIYTHNGIEDITFEYQHQYSVVQYGSERVQIIKMQLSYRNGWNINIIASGKGTGAKFNEAAISIPAEQMMKFTEMIVLANSLKMVLETETIAPYAGELLGQ